MFHNKIKNNKKERYNVIMKMKIKINEKKVNVNSEYTVEEIYKKIDDLAKSVGIIKKDEEGLYIGNNDRYDLANFGRIAMALEECKWFMQCVEEWIWYLDDGIEDMIEFYHSIRREAV